MEKKERNELKNRFIDNGWSYKFEEYQDGDISQFELEKFFLDFVEQELDKAREEGYQDCLDDIWEEAKGLRGWTEHDGNVSATDIEAGLQEAYLNIEENRKEVSI